MSKVIDTTWFSPGSTPGMIGLSAIEKDSGEVVFRIGIGNGYNIADDEKLILQWGAKFDPTNVINFIERNKK